MIGRKQKKVLSIFTNHVVDQEAEINQRKSMITEYRTKFGDIGVTESAASQKADLEKKVHGKRQENQALTFSLTSKEEELSMLVSNLKQLEEGLQNLTSNISSSDLEDLQSQIHKLETEYKEIDNTLKEKENQVNNLLKTKKT